MGFKEKISIIVDADTKAGTAGLKSLGHSIREADGFTGKLKAGWSGAMDSLKANVATAAMAAGAALVAFGVKAVGAFLDTATAAREFGAATGMAVEDASRWIAIGDDMGITADALETSVAKIGKTIDDNKWAKYGVATRDAGGEARSSNDILLDSLDALGKIENQTERTRVGNELFGKGYSNLSPLVGKTREEYQKWLGSVEDGQVITADEAEKAERMRLAQDALGDALGEVTLAFGGVVAGLGPFIEGLASGIQKALDLSEALGGLGASGGITDQAFLDIRDKTDWANTSLDVLNGTIKTFYLNSEQAAELTALWNEANGVAAESTNFLAEAVHAVDVAAKRNIPTIREAKEAFFGVATAAAEADREISDLKGEIDDQQAWLDMLDTLDDYNATMADAEASDRDKVRSGLAVQEELIGRLEAIDNLPAEKQTEILTLIEQGKYDEALWAIGVLTADRNVKIGFEVGDIPRLPGQKYASGTPSAAPGVALVGEQGPELVMMGGGERVLTASQTRGALGGGGGVYNITVNGANMSPDQLVAAIKAWERRNGPGWRS